MEYVGFSACPADAVEAVKRKAGCVCIHPGGQGALREMVEAIHNMAECYYTEG